MLGGDFWFLFLNASVVWLVIAIVLMKLFRLKALVIVLIITPFVIGSTFRNIAGIPELIGFYQGMITERLSVTLRRKN